MDHTEMDARSKPRKWGPIVVVGGSGRLGYAVIDRLLRQPECGHIISINRSDKIKHGHDGVEYSQVDIRNGDAVQVFVQKVKPQVMINLAAPVHHNQLTQGQEFREVLVEGQKNLLQSAQDNSVSVFISTTSANVAAGYEHLDIDETAPLWPEDSSAFPYWVMKAVAERLVLAADSPELRTISLRLPLIIGERDYAFVPSMLDTLEQGNTKVQLGDNTNHVDAISTENAAEAHILALRALLNPELGVQVHGEAFFISCLRPMHFWDMIQTVWRAAGWEPTGKPFAMPTWAAMVVATVSEWAVYLISGGTREPLFSRHVVRFCTNNFTYSSQKARERLKYDPRDDIKEALEQSVRWELARRRTQKLH